MRYIPVMKRQLNRLARGGGIKAGANGVQATGHGFKAACELSPTLEDPLEYIWIMFSAPCLTFCSMSICLFRAARRLLLGHSFDSLFGVSGVKGHSG